MLKNKINRVVFEYRLLVLSLLVIFATIFIKSILLSNGLLIPVSIPIIIVLGIQCYNCLVLFFQEYVFDECHLNEHEQYLLSRKKKYIETKDMLRKISFLTGHKNGYQNENIEKFIDIERDIFFSKDEYSFCEQDFNDFKQSEDYFVERYAPVLENICKKKYQTALELLDAMEGDDNLINIPKNFYLVFVLNKLGIDNWETRNSINVIKNRGKESRYYQYAEKLW